MSIAPVQSFPPAKNDQSENATVRSDKTVARPAAKPIETEPVQSVSVTLPKQEKPVAKSVPSTYTLPEDVVEVHQDPESKGQVIQYLDKSKNVVLQVPSSEELGVERGIAQELQEAAKPRANPETAEAAVGVGKNYGD
jgi:hypothetical protein